MAATRRSGLFVGTESSCSKKTTDRQGYDEVFWAGGAVELTPDEWWLTRLCELRNAIVHGDDVSEDLWEHDGSHQLDHIHDHLIEAMRAALSKGADDPALKDPPGERAFARAMQEIIGEAESSEGDSGDDE
jgi:hypothetical protein